MSAHSATVLHAVLGVLKPAVRLLLRHGITYPAFATALKRVFLDAAQAELASRGMPATDSAITLLCGVHRRDVRTLTRGSERAASPAREPLSLATQVVARWLHEPGFVEPDGLPRPLPRSGDGASFDDLVAALSRDVRPRAVLDELKRLGVVTEDESTVTLRPGGFAPRQGFDEMATLFADNLHDHLAAAAANLQGDRNFLEQSVFVDQITEASAARLHTVSAQAWQQAFQTLMGEAQRRFDTDAAEAPPDERRHRARVGIYFFSDRES
ncbi:DUF6502 family protein [Ideonella sp. A 288]|uniref:DUF6502 family protein n=1 Tax=Ideonella sp. A 288 TaxID=1962181 RepID=UPI000B4B6CEC|nr:DUF6502 family protein [Ideonella sp. A 288]